MEENVMEEETMPEEKGIDHISTALPIGTEPPQSGSGKQPNDNEPEANKAQAYLSLSQSSQFTLMQSIEDDHAQQGREPLHNPSMRHVGREASCADCRDMGWLSRGYDYEPDHPDFGKLDPCHCHERLSRSRYMASIGNLEQYTFGSWKLNANPKADDAFHAAVRWVQGDAPPWLIITGPYGCGKTHLALAAAADLKIRPIYRQVPTLLNSMRASMDASSITDQTLNQIRYELVQTPALILDEFGREHATDWTVSELENLLLQRYHHQRQTLIVSNDLRPMTPMIQSRLQDASVCRLVDCTGASDMRKGKTFTPQGGYHA